MDIERAERAVIALLNRLLEDDLVNRSIVILVGTTQSAAVALKVARSLWEADVWVQIICPESYSTYPSTIAATLEELQTLGIPQAWAEEGWELPPSDLLIDALIGAGLKESPQGRAREIIMLANSSAAPILSIDVPSGVGSDQGQLFTPHINAMATVMCGMPYPALLNSPARVHCGKLYLADVGFSAQAYAEQGIQSPPIFDKEGLILVT